MIKMASGDQRLGLAGGGVYSTQNKQFVATPAIGAKTITITGLSFNLEAENVSNGELMVRSSAGYLSPLDVVNVTVSSNVITLLTMPQVFQTGDTVEGIIIGPDQRSEKDTNVQRSVRTNVEWDHQTSPIALLSAAFELGSSFLDMGSEIPVGTFEYLTLWVTLDLTNGGPGSADVQIRVLHKHTSAGSEEYRQIYLGNPASNLVAINLVDYEINSDADQLFKITLDVKGSRFIQLQAKDSADGDGQIDALTYTLD